MTKYAIGDTVELIHDVHFSQHEMFRLEWDKEYRKSKRVVSEWIDPHCVLCDLYGYTYLKVRDVGTVTEVSKGYGGKYVVFADYGAGGQIGVSEDRDGLRKIRSCMK